MASKDDLSQHPQTESDFVRRINGSRDISPRYNEPYASHSITARNRAVLVDWLFDVAQEFALRGDTIFLAVDLLDRFLAREATATAWLQLLGSACIWIAAKAEEAFAPSAQDMINLTEDVYTVAELEHMEHSVLQHFAHDLQRPTIHTFLSQLLHVSRDPQRLSATSPCLTLATSLDNTPQTQPPLGLWQRIRNTHAQTLHHANSHLKTPTHSSSPPCTPCHAVHSSLLQRLHKESIRRTMSQQDSMMDTAGANSAAVGWGHVDSAPGSFDASLSILDQAHGTLDHGTLDKDHMQLVHLSRLVAEACLLDADVMRHSPAGVAAACLMLARSMLGKPTWTAALVQQSGIDSPAAVAACVVAVADAYAHARQDSELCALQSRYLGRRMDVFALEPSRQALELVEASRVSVRTTSRSATPVQPAQLAAQLDALQLSTHSVCSSATPLRHPAATLEHLAAICISAPNSFHHQPPEADQKLPAGCILSLSGCNQHHLQVLSTMQAALPFLDTPTPGTNCHLPHSISSPPLPFLLSSDQDVTRPASSLAQLLQLPHSTAADHSVSLAHLLACSSAASSRDTLAGHPALHLAPVAGDPWCGQHCGNASPGPPGGGGGAEDWARPAPR